MRLPPSLLRPLPPQLIHQKTQKINQIVSSHQFFRPIFQDFLHQYLADSIDSIQLVWNTCATWVYDISTTHRDIRGVKSIAFCLGCINSYVIRVGTFCSSQNENSLVDTAHQRSQLLSTYSRAGWNLFW